MLGIPESDSTLNGNQVSTSIRWRVPPKISLIWERWAYEAIVYNTLSGETHFLNESAMLLLEKLQQATQTEDSLKKHLSEQHTPSKIPAEQIFQILNEFEQLGLIEKVE